MPHRAELHDSAPTWDAYLAALQVCINERTQLLKASKAQDDSQLSVTLTSVDNQPALGPTAEEHRRALHLQSLLLQQETEFETALAAVAAEIERVEKLRAAQMSRSVIEINVGGFEARA